MIKASVSTIKSLANTAATYCIPNTNPISGLLYAKSRKSLVIDSSLYISFNILGKGFDTVFEIFSSKVLESLNRGDACL